MNTKVLPIVALVVIIGSMAVVQQANAYQATYKVWMTITNTKTDEVKTFEWTVSKYSFEKDKGINIDDMKLKKIKQIFGGDQFLFNSQIGEYENTWHHFNVYIAAEPSRGSSLRITFV